jgi:hypothetical protein
MEDDRSRPEHGPKTLVDHRALETWAREYVRRFFGRLDALELRVAHLERSASASVWSDTVH